MKKHLLLGLISASGMILPLKSMAQDVTYYWPKERVETLQSGSKYFLYNTAYEKGNNPEDRGSFLFANDNGNFGTLNPKQTANNFLTQEKKYVFTITDAGNNTANCYKIQNYNNLYINFTGAPSNEDPAVFLIQNWKTTTAAKGTCGGKADDGSYIEPANLGENKVWTVTNNNAPTGNNSQWNGNGSFVLWSNSHPYTFYTVGEATLTAEANTAYEERWNNAATGTAVEMAWNLQKAYGMVKDASKISSNKPETDQNENSSYAHLIDGQDGTKFHSSWSNPGQDKHYLQFEIANPTSTFYFITKRRSDNMEARPVNIKIEGSNEANSGFTEITTISSDLPTNQYEWYYFSDKIDCKGQQYKYLRFTVMATSTNTIFFHYSEFYLINAAANGAEAAMNAVRGYYNLNVKNAGFSTENVTTAKSTFDTQLAAVKEAANNATYTIKCVNEKNTEFNSTSLTIPTGQSVQVPTFAFREATKVSAGSFDSTNKTITLQGNESITDKTITVTYADRLPFTVSDDNNLSAATWYQMSVHYGGSKRYVKYNKDNKNKIDLIQTGNADLTQDNQLWCFVGNMTDGFQIYNKEGGKDYSITYSTQYTESNDKLAIMASPNTDLEASTWLLTETRDATAKQQKGFCWKTKKTTGLDGSNVYLNHRNTFLSYWSDNDGGSAFFVHDAKEEADKKLTAAVTRGDEIKDHFGNGLNQYSEAQKIDFDTKLQAAKDKQNSGTYTEKLTAANELKSCCEALTLNEPTAGKFYRFKSVTLSNYIASNGKSGRPVMMAQGTDQNTVFFYTKDKKLVTSSMLCMDNYNVSNSLGMATTFQTSKSKCGYVIRNNNGSYSAKASGQQVDREGSEAAGKTNSNCAWILEEVTETTHQPSLMKTMGSDYATLSAPVALTIPEGVEAYTAKVDDGNRSVTLHQLTGVVPAGVGVVLKKAPNHAGTQNFDFKFSAELGDATTANGQNNLHPLYTDTSIPTATTAYVLARLESGKIGFYLLKPDGTTEERTVGANKSYLVLPNVAPANALLSLVIGGTTTGIESVTEGTGGKEVFFDLQGRRVEKPTKGIYVTRSGKKVIFK